MAMTTPPARFPHSWGDDPAGRDHSCCLTCGVKSYDGEWSPPDDCAELLRRELDRLTARLAEVEAKLSAAVQDAAIGEAVIAAVYGEPVSDFMESFGPVRAAMDLRAQVEASAASTPARDEEAAYQRMLDTLARDEEKK